ncbi:hypothetical protein ORV05_13890 [Amycolatopsis cynarae]|uniref:Uncharacterized protein n=1 Tax=Amycolatopsis cynarae TaxID=2995223 RepID=A0ABY7BAV2_9PSEU|nr:hypothetical protein [Amycolatopsis sp. HUAS 11-8]WAL68808.1 hypothetical protein ORV05_13890 [Amycolatopsis sp. HUAS 11-8]
MTDGCICCFWAIRDSAARGAIPGWTTSPPPCCAFGLTCVLIGHNLAIIESLCDRVGVLRQGSLVEIFAADELFSPERHPDTRALLDAVLPIHSRRDREAS